jgi:glycosyltransferase involved in cell wall biosynthesis
MTLIDNQPLYSVVIPVYNPGEPLLELVARLQNVFVNDVKETFEIILVDDGSPDKTTHDFLRRAAKEPFVKSVFLSRNFGKPGAVMCGLQQSKGEWVVTIDDDLQQFPEDIPALIALKEHDVVIAKYDQKHHTKFQILTSRIKYSFDRNILGYKIRLSPLKLLKRHVVEGMLVNQTNRPFIPALIRDVTDNIVSADATHAPSAYGKSRYSFRGRWRQFTNLLFGNSILLMKLLGWIGLLTMLGSLIFAVVIVFRKIAGITVETGWSSMMVAVLFIGGLNLGTASLIGQYLIRILDVTSSKPAFIVREII